MGQEGRSGGVGREGGSVEGGWEWGRRVGVRQVGGRV